VNTGEACVAHCLVLLREGDKELAACAKKVQDTIAFCTALRQMAAAILRTWSNWLEWLAGDRAPGVVRESWILAGSLVLS